jgi:alkylation response protein AidB-like acyl-CoA dehydrogenase
MSTETEDTYRRNARAWFAEHLPADWYERRTADVVEFDRWWLRELHEGRYLVPRWPVEDGGQDLSPDLELALGEEMKAAGAPFPQTFYCALHHVVDALREFGSDEQKQKYMPDILGGRTIWCQAFSEPNAGSDLANLQATARRDGDFYVINGQKTWSSGANRADRAILPARTDPDAAKRRGISYFLVDLRSPGVEVRPIQQMSGVSGFSEIFLDDVRVPASDLLGEEGQGWSIIKSTLNTERGPGFLGFARETRERIGDLIDQAANTDRLFSDEPGWTDLRQELAKEFAEAEILDEFCQQLLSQLRETGQVGNIASVVKLHQSELLKRVTESGLRVEGLEGLLFDGPRGGDSEEGEGWLFNHLRSWIFIIGAGTSEIQRNNISEGVLGLPREPQVKGA